jgi:diacylglycerol diphosphate phosphatase/phosphatidate phosphatase
MLTKALAANGAHRIHIVGRREDVLHEAANFISPGIVIPLFGDITSQESLLHIGKRVKADTGYVNLLIANAGMMGPKPLEPLPNEPPPSITDYRAHALETPKKEFTQTYAVNTTGVYYTTIAFLNLFEAGNTKANMGPD